MIGLNTLYKACQSEEFDWLNDQSYFVDPHVIICESVLTFYKQYQK